jgi:hypothetical protein
MSQGRGDLSRSELVAEIERRFAAMNEEEVAGGESKPPLRGAK